jgi:hypothetical protein
MRILKEAFSETMPAFVKDLMTQPDAYWGNRQRKHVADFFRHLDPATAAFEDVKGCTVTELRNRMKNSEVIFILEPSANEWSDQKLPLAIIWDASKGAIVLTGKYKEQFKEYSFKKLIENAVEVYASPITDDRAVKRTDRINSRKGLISRKGDSAQPTEGRYSFDGADWQEDASGYWYDANRLANKLAKMHAEDTGYYTKKAAKSFITMANAYADKVKEMAADTDNLDLSTFGEGGFESVTRDGQRLLRDVGEKMQRIKELAELQLMSMDEVNERRAANGADPLSEEDYENGRDYRLREIMRYSAEIEEKKRAFNNLIK